MTTSGSGSGHRSQLEHAPLAAGSLQDGAPSWSHDTSSRLGNGHRVPHSNSRYMVHMSPDFWLGLVGVIMSSWGHASCGQRMLYGSERCTVHW